MGETVPREILDVKGTVKWFDSKKGFGFINGPDGQDVFAHYTKIEGSGFRALKDGATVIFDAQLGEKGWHATRITFPAEVKTVHREKAPADSTGEKT
ncbi:MAG TPA: cold shock domain-containing protein [Phycisphaeraceae bacterium]|nr:cold shock domain-containing protein [Phycisphaeraceae bacterium]